MRRARLLRRYMENSRWRYPHADWEAALATARSQLAGAPQTLIAHVSEHVPCWRSWLVKHSLP